MTKVNKGYILYLMTTEKIQTLLRELENALEVLKPVQEQLDRVKDELKKGMDEAGLEKLNNGKLMVSYVNTKRTILDQKKAIDLLTAKQRQECIKEIESRMFRVTEVKIKK